MTEKNNMLAKKPANDIKSQIESMQEQFALVVPKCLTPERMVRVALSALGRTPKLKDCTRQSLLGSLMTCAELGIEPDGRRAHLIPYGKECTLIVDYKGLVELVRRSGQVQDVRAEIVCENDSFEWNNGAIIHSINFKQPRGEMYAAYSYVLFKDGAESFEVMTKDEIEAVRNRSRAGKSGPWQTDFNEMAKKTVFRRHSKWLPLSPEFRDALDKDADAPADITVSTPVYMTDEDDGKQHAPTGDDIEEPDIPLATEVEEEKREETPPPAEEDPAPTSEDVSDVDSKKDELTPVDSLDKSACMAEMKLHQDKPYFAGLLANFIPEGSKAKDCPVGLLRDIVAELRVEADRKAED